MRVRLLVQAAMAATMLGTVGASLPAAAQYGRYYDGDDGPPPPRYRRNDDDYGGGPPRFRRGGGGSVCVTARGNCPYPPRPPNYPCGCDIPGFGLKRGAIGY